MRKIIISGPRTLTNERAVIAGIFHGLGKLKVPIAREDWYTEIEIVSGMAEGVDTIACGFFRRYCASLAEFPVTREDWQRRGNRAGNYRNGQMARHARTGSQKGALISVHDSPSFPASSGSLSMWNIGNDFMLDTVNVSIYNALELEKMIAALNADENRWRMLEQEHEKSRKLEALGRPRSTI